MSGVMTAAWAAPRRHVACSEGVNAPRSSTDSFVTTPENILAVRGTRRIACRGACSTLGPGQQDRGLPYVLKQQHDSSREKRFSYTNKIIF